MDLSIFKVLQSENIGQLLLILEAGCNINCRNERSESLLLASLIHLHEPEGRLTVVRKLIDLGADVNAQNNRGQTPLMYACILHQCDTFSTLLHCKSVDPNIQDNEGNTCLMYACALGNVLAVRILIGSVTTSVIDLKYNLCNNQGYTALQFAIDDDRSEVIDILTSAFKNATVNSNSSNNDYTFMRKKRKRKRSGDSEKLIQVMARDVESLTKLEVNPFTLVEPKEEQNAEQPDQQLTFKSGDIVGPDGDSDSRSRDSSKRPDSGDVVGSKACMDTSVSRLKMEVPPFMIIDVFPVGKKSILAEETLLYDEAGDSENKLRDDAGEARPPQESKSSTTSKGRSRLRSRNRNSLLKSNGDISGTRTSRTGETCSDIQHGVIEFGDEFAFCNRIYGADLWPSLTDTSSRDSILNYKDKSEISSIQEITHRPFFLRRDKNDFNTTARLNCFNMSSEHKARIMSRPVWSVYGDPLPAIPLSTLTITRSMKNFNDLRRYLAQSKFESSRLLRLDPELWCIIESIRRKTEKERRYSNEL
ncbi:hypothetical protein CHS0354_029012 [Potamilus streckersoni]|uniref:Uncharacterized protein n=1 Tax=Potamilus streckersoni TaxID=2493646 RepID=A0AAE0VUI6_9BIVA|nr:hypothetical protein CHS0354_029012 [Potamilus streckersoni]